jgi:hypothetical protein
VHGQVIGGDADETPHDRLVTVGQGRNEGRYVVNVTARPGGQHAADLEVVQRRRRELLIVVIVIEEVIGLIDGIIGALLLGSLLGDLLGTRRPLFGLRLVLLVVVCLFSTALLFLERLVGLLDGVIAVVDGLLHVLEQLIVAQRLEGLRFGGRL